jgi:hypothetical protein
MMNVNGDGMVSCCKEAFDVPNLSKPMTLESSVEISGWIPEGTAAQLEYAAVCGRCSCED